MLEKTLGIYYARIVLMNKKCEMKKAIELIFVSITRYESVFGVNQT